MWGRPRCRSRDETVRKVVNGSDKEEGGRDGPTEDGRVATELRPQWTDRERSPDTSGGIKLTKGGVKGGDLTVGRDVWSVE